MAAPKANFKGFAAVIRSLVDKGEYTAEEAAKILREAGGRMGAWRDVARRLAKGGGPLGELTSFILPKESLEEGEAKAREALSPWLRLVRKRYSSTRPSEGA